jgi:HEAT repeat protein
LTDARRQVRISAAVALAHIEPTGPEPLPVLIEALGHWQDEELDVQQVPGALGVLGPLGQAALPALIGLAKEGCEDPDVYRALVLIDPEGKACVPALIAALEHKDIDVVDIVVNCLSLLGPRAKEAVPALATAMTRNFDEAFSNGYQPQVGAAKALRRIGPDAKLAIPALIGALSYRHVVHDLTLGELRDCESATAAAEVLGSFGAGAKSAVPALIQAVRTREKDDDTWELRVAAIRALREIGQDAVAAAPVLRGLLKDESESLQYVPEVLATLARLAPDGRALAEAWINRPAEVGLGHMGRSLVMARALVLGNLGRTSAEADHLIRSDLFRLNAMFADDYPPEAEPPRTSTDEWFERFGRFGIGGRLALPRLREFQKDPDPWVRMWATEAIARITPRAG